MEEITIENEEMSEHPLLHSEKTVCVELQKKHGRRYFTPCNLLAQKFLESLDQDRFVEAELKWIKSLGYDVLIIGPQTREL